MLGMQEPSDVSSHIVTSVTPVTPLSVSAPAAPPGGADLLQEPGECQQSSPDCDTRGVVTTGLMTHMCRTGESFMCTH